MKFKVGDEVRIRTDLVPQKHYPHLLFTQDMLRYCGEKSNIIKIDSIDDTYLIKIDNGKHWWSDDMLEPVETKKAEPKLKLVIESDLKHNITATQTIGNDILKVEANSHPDDEFDFADGLSLIFKRLSDKMQGIINEKPKEKFRPHLMLYDEFMGNLGDSTPLTDILGNHLCVGDLVIVYKNGKICNEATYIVWDGDKHKYGVMGTLINDYHNGRCIHNKDLEYAIVKCKDFSEITERDEYCHITPIIIG